LNLHPLRARRVLGPILALVVAAAATACQTPLLDTSPDLERTWERALVLLPLENGSVRRLAARDAAGTVRADRRLPTIVYMHGCTGIRNLAFLERLAQAGYAVIAPDSLARRYRPLQCDPQTSTGGRNRFVYAFREAELSYALQRLAEHAWVDHGNLFLIGTSEGGVTAALYRGDEFRARVIAQWTCTGAALVRGIDAPADTPILAIVAADDPWYDPSRTIGQRGTCGDHLGTRAGSRSVVIAGRGQHDVLGDEAVIRLILKFLAQHQG